jgi:hypothetical protein
MGFRSLGACFLSKIISSECRHRLAFVALDGDQITDHFHGDATAGTGTDGKDVIRFVLKDDLTPYPSPAVAGMVTVHQGQRRPCHLGQFFPVMGASALVHGAQPRMSVVLNGSFSTVYWKDEKKFWLFSGFFWFFRGHGRRKMALLGCCGGDPAFSGIGLWSIWFFYGEKAVVLWLGGVNRARLMAIQWGKWLFHGQQGSTYISKSSLGLLVRISLPPCPINIISSSFTTPAASSIMCISKAIT